MIKGTVAALVAGVIGAAVWAAVSHFTGYEIGIIAWAVGGLVGFGMLVGAGNQANVATGIVAAVIAVVAVLGGKYATVHIGLEQALAGAGSAVTYTEQDMLSMHADDVVIEWEDEGRTIDWPDGMSFEEAYEESDYPSDVWAEGKSRWDALSDAEQQAAIAAASTNATEAWGTLKSEIRWEAFVQSFALFDLLWMGLAVMTALKLGAGATNE